ncbi:MAG: toluene tolerance protein [Rhodospirillaceae bacterium]|jgi:phospholipid transport system substrate-binding protein|nr:toluene tolerance protein [Rhodospirillaceae bacterium]MDP6644343.1 ABC transporter substrate-binding protein [Rhodospirillales bacterium]|tara:strand:- start:710 stop:1381 length:672 start_codon:yes stop_codon:yes gene_type:complete
MKLCVPKNIEFGNVVYRFPTAARRLGILLMVWVWAISQSASGQASAGPASELVEKFHNVLIGVMKKGGNISVQQRYEILSPKVRKTFNLPFMIRIVSGAAWRSANDNDKKALLDAFTKMSVSTYASRFDDYSGQKFETLAESQGPKKSVLVRTRIVSPGDTPVKLTYVVRKFADKWRVIDVILAGGISELALRHSEYRAILKKDGPLELAATLSKKSDQILGK